MADAKTLISLSLKDEASKQLRTVSGNFKKTLKEMESGDLDLDGSIGKLTGGLGGAGALLGLGGVTAGVALLGNAIGDMATQAGQLELVRGSFDSLAASAGQSSDAMLAAMRSASQGMVSDYDLILSANKAMMLGVADTGEELASLLEIARSRGAAMGLSLTQAFSDIVTGLGRESALILDNLGITIDTAAAMDAYAKTLGTTADALDSAQRKQALLNAVMAQTPASTGTAGSGVATAVAQAEAARANAEAAGGAFFAPLVREVEQGKAQLFQALAGTYDEFAARMSDINDILADSAGDSRVSAAWTARFTELQGALATVGNALANGVPGAQDYADALSGIAAQATVTRQITDQQATSIALIARQAQLSTTQFNAYRATIDANTSAFQALYSPLNLAGNTLRELDGIAAASRVELEALAAKLGWVGQMALAASSDLASFNANVASIQSAINATNAVIASGKSQAESLAMQAIQGGADPALVRQLLVETTTAIDGLTYAYQNNAGAQFDNRMQVNATISPLESLVEQTNAANAAAKQYASSGLKEMDAALENLRGRVGGVLSESLSLDAIGVNPSDFLPRPDAVQEDAFRLADVMVNGFASPWAAYFESTFPALFSEMTKGGDIQAGAAAILQQFQSGMRPELLNFDAIKEKVKAALAMDDAIAGMRDQITAELTGAGASASQVQGALASVLGGLGLSGPEAAPDLTTTGSGAADSFSTGFTATANGGALMTKISAQMVAQVTVFDNAGRQAGTKWGVGFTAVVEQSVPPYLIDMLTRLVTPGVLAALAARDGAEGAQ